MASTRRVQGKAAAWSIVLGTLLSAAMAHAEEPARVCARAAYEGQGLRDAGSLGAARASFLQCVKPECPDLVVKDCSAWLAQVEARLPSVVLGARDANGNDLLDVTVTLDGKPFAVRLDGKSLIIDPGPHAFHFENARGETAELNIIAREGDKGRIVTATLSPGKPREASPAAAAPAAEPHPEPKRSGVPLGAVILGGVGVVAIGSFAFFGITGQSDKSALSDSCAKTSSCSADSVSAAKTKLIVADVSLGAGLVALGVAAVWAITGSAQPPSKTSGSARVDVVPILGGVACSVSRAF